MDGTLTAEPPQNATSTQQAKFRTLLAELFMLDQADLDFGIYRIMNAKRDEITRFLDNDLLPQIRDALGTLEDAGRGTARQELATLVKTLTDAGMDPEQSPKVRELRAKYGAGADPAAAEAEVFSHLYQFFRRYYHEGDFLSLRRYKEGVYAIPYEGEEVKLHWANADQYYIKTGEYFRDYTFTLPDGRRVHFRLADADTERNNNKAAAGQERRFVLAEPEPVEGENGELTVRFTYRPTESKTKQTVLNEAAEAEILRTAPEGWRAALAAKAPTEKNGARTLLAKHLADYTARNTFDYFIHKDLGGFLRRELDFYLKNEVMHLDDIESESAPRVEQYLAKLRAVRRIGHKIIDFLAQLEDFQKRLWLKRKFVVETQWCATLDRVPEALYPEIGANEAQRAEWVRLFAIGELDGYAAPLTPDFLRANPFLVLDTRFFDRPFTDRLLASDEILGDADSLDDATNGLLVHSENFQALMLLQERYREQAKCIYIDPPYNTGSSEILYKNTFKHSAWMTMMHNRLRVSASMSGAQGSLIVAIDENEQKNLGMLLERLFPDHEQTGIVVVHNPAGVQGRNFSYTHESAYFVFPQDGVYIGNIDRKDDLVSPLRDWGGTSARNLAKTCFYPIQVRNGTIVGFGDVCAEDLHPSSANCIEGDLILVYPIDNAGIERKWVFSRNSVEKNQDQLFVKEQDGDVVIMRRKSHRKYRTVWDDKRYYANIYGSKLLSHMFGAQPFSFPKSIHTVEDSIKAIIPAQAAGATTLDYFAGSGTTGHAVINLNREDGGSRKYILVEMGEYFDTVLKPRIQKVVYSKDWKDGIPVGREGSSHLFKTLRLESYEDTLNNLALARTPEQQELLDAEREFREDYTLRYMLDVESRGSQSLLNLARFDDPFAYTLRIGTGSADETRETAVDLIETFNYLLGLRVKHVDHIRGVRVLHGTSPEGERVLVLWRNVTETPSDALNDWFRKQGYNTRDQEWDVVYVNGDNHLENLRRPDETWKVRLTEEEFHRRMWDARAV
jgi:adenine-specific DNA-methyltransferase